MKKTRHLIDNFIFYCYNPKHKIQFGCIFSVCIISSDDRYTSCSGVTSTLAATLYIIIAKFVLPVKNFLDIVYTNSK